MKNFKFYFKDINGKSFSEYVKADNFESAVNIAFDKKNVEVDIDKTVMAFFKEN